MSGLDPGLEPGHERVCRVAIGLGIAFAWARSLIPSMIAHVIINVPMTTVWQGALLVVFLIGAFFAWRGGVQAVQQVFTNTKVAACAVLAALGTAYVIAAGRVDSNDVRGDRDAAGGGGA